MTKKIRGVSFEENENNTMGLSFYNLSHRFGYQSPNWPYFEDVKIERIHYMAKVRRAVAAHHHIDAQHHAYRRPGACRSGNSIHRRSAAAAFLRPPAS